MCLGTIALFSRTELPVVNCYPSTAVCRWPAV